MGVSNHIDALRRRVENDPASIAFAQLGEEYRRAGQLADAVETCRAGLVIHPDYTSARVTLGRALLALGRLDEASTELQRVVDAAPDNLAARRALADTCRRQGRSDDALAHFAAARSLAPDDPGLERIVTDHRDAATLEAMEQWLEAIHAARADVRS
jgi:tetratricopeptide (TPR) repeat protein